MPVTRALMYDDRGFGEEAALIARSAPKPHITQGPNSALAPALRLSAEDTRGHARHLLHQADFVAARLTGRGGHSDRNHALKTGADPVSGRWPEWMALLPLRPEILPQIHRVGAPVAPLSEQIARRFGLSREAMVHAGTTDGIAAFLAAASTEQGAAVTSIGTTLAVKLYSGVRIDDAEIGLYAHRIGEG